MSIEFVVQLTDQVTAPAQRARNSLTSLADRMKFLESSAKSLEKQMTKASALGDMEKVSRLSTQHAKLTSALDRSGLASETAAKKTKSFSSSITSATSELAPYLALLATYAAAIGAVIAALYEGGKLAIAASEFKEDSLMSFRALTGSAAAGRATLGIIRDLEREVPETEAQLVERAKGLLAQGLDTSKLKASLLSISDINATMGDQAGAKIQSLLERITTTGKFQFSGKMLKGTGITEAELAKQLGLPDARTLDAMMKANLISADRGLDAINAVARKKYGGTAAQQVGNMAGLANKLHDSFSHLFEDVDTGPFTSGLKQIVDLFDTNTASGKAMKWMIEQVFNKAFKESGPVLLMVKHGIQEVIIHGLKLYIAMKPAIAELKSLWAQAKKSETLKTAILGLAIVMGVLAAAILIPAAILVMIGAVVLTTSALFVGGIALIIGAAVKMSNAVRKKFMGWGHMAKDVAAKFIDGLVHGITKGIGLVQKAAHKLAGVLPKGIADKLEIKSPSRVAERLFAQVPAGAVRGLARGEERVGVAAARLGASAADGAAAGGAGGRRGGGGGVHAEKIEVHNHGVDSEGKALRVTATALADVLEQLALKEGLGLAT